jgi:hypothetical protein
MAHPYSDLEAGFAFSVRADEVPNIMDT